MGLYKELNAELERLENRQVAIYPDAADAGIPVASINAPVCLAIRNLLRMDHYSGGLKQHRKEERTPGMIQVYITINIPWEMENGLYRCTAWTVAYFDDIRRSVKFISIRSHLVYLPSSMVFS